MAYRDGDGVMDGTAVPGAVGPGVIVALKGVLSPPVGKMVTVLLPTTVMMVVVRLVKILSVGVMVVVFNDTVGPGVTVAFPGILSPPVDRIAVVFAGTVGPGVTVAFPGTLGPPVGRIAVVFTDAVGPGVTVAFPGTLSPPVGGIAVVFAGMVGSDVTVAFLGALGPPVGRIVNVLLSTTVVIVVEMLVKMFPVGAIVVVFRDVIDAGVAVGPGAYVEL